MEKYFNSHEKRVKCFEIHVERFRDTFKGFTREEIKTEWIDNAKSNYAPGVRYADVVALYDTSAFGKGKTGFLFTDEYLYWKRSISKGVIKLSDIERVTYYDETQRKDTNRGIIFYMKRGANVMWDGCCLVKSTPFIAFMEDYISIK